MKTLAPLLASVLVALGGPAAADAFDALPAVADDELDAARGGFLLDGGRIASLGLEIRTLVGGREVLTTSLTVGPAGLSKTESLGDGYDAADAAALGAAAAKGLDLRGFGDARVVLVSDGTAVLHRIGRDTLQNLVVNSADGLDLRQEITLRVDLLESAVLGDRLSVAGLRLALDQADVVRTGFR